MLSRKSLNNDAGALDTVYMEDDGWRDDATAVDGQPTPWLQAPV